MLPALGLFLRTLFDFDLIYDNQLWYYVLGGMIALTFGVLQITKEVKAKMKPTRWQVLGGVLVMGIGSFVYCFGAFGEINCNFDYSEPEVFATEIVEKRVSSGKTTTYHFDLAPWGPFAENEEAQVSKDQYESLQAGDSINVYLKKGALGTKWYFVY